ncbi:flavin-containing monooxygenase [Pseudonocardia halophobica]|uniref:flavin-containing monooxygenase n=1 Tax=Pseudonocardia halophobica TaxID=29401 RepID=UPI003D90D932
MSTPLSTPEYDAVVVGAGFAGLYALHALRGEGMSVLGFETGHDVGGTWFWNRYPGARCDTESLDYSYSFDKDLQQDWTWSERYATQPEILRYLNHVADRFALRPLIRFGTEVTSAVYDEPSATWSLSTSTAETVRARYVIMAAGVLSSLKDLDFPGLDRFRGTRLHTARWPHEGVDLSGKRVAVIGTGSSGVQLVPKLAPQTEHLYVLQRTANFSVPARNRPVLPDEVAREKASYDERRAEMRASRAGMKEIPAEGSALAVDPDERTRIFEWRWAYGGGPPFLRTFTDLATDEAANATAAEFVRSKIRETVADPETAESLCPTGFPIGTKRLCVDTDYYATFNRSDVTLVDLRKTPLVEFTENGIRTTTEEIGLDVVVFATGFDALTGALTRIDVRGRGGDTVAAHWADGPRTMLGLAVAGFPNLFTVTGPGSPSVLGNVVASIEQHVEWIVDCLRHARERGATTVEATREGEDDWSRQCAEIADQTLMARNASWYTGANIPGKPRQLLPYAGGVGRFREICDDVAARGYAGFRFS